MSANIRRINLALQGGGAHGAFTWGALVRLLEEETIEIASISGTSAGALNGAALKAGLSCPEAADPRQKAIETLNWLWTRIGAVQDLRLTAWINVFGPVMGIMRDAYFASPAYLAAEAASGFVSPYMYGPAYRNPLEDIVGQLVFDDVCATARGPDFFVCTTRVRDGKSRIFTGAEISVEAILASACLPTIFQAVEIHDPKTGRDEIFYDGGYTGNPALYPMFAPHLPDDIVVININPLERDQLPVTPQDIANRVNEISFNSSLLRELRAITFVKRLLATGRIPEGSMRDVNIHMIADDRLMTSLSVSTKLVPSPYLLGRLHKAGYAAADAFLGDHGDKIGHDSSVDIATMFN
ncbi:patatin-like phospholipase family protein [Mangrovicoccus algicola]|uniref:Patatin-like phospholipase family protein n=1 Tax=Mangrovicoccus algicola TaxID=2771008 RepID=A0A8J6YVF5_9RHOB|nr:patatin-like phospholipase family protein [Mangrovicoccus algicola]MBE3638492.1 patatin-like phospholipase family protein [Mangrovicoccus algicola]